MRKKILIITTITLISFLSYAQSTTNSKLIKPAGYYKKIETVVDGKTRSYYALSASEASVINVQGPGTLKVYTRGQFKSGEESSIKYTILYSIDGVSQKAKVASGISKSKAASFADINLGFPGEPFTFELELARGAHTIEFKLNDITVNVAARYIFTPAKLKKQEWMAFSPQLPSEPVDLISKESSTLYYRFSMVKPLSVSIIGPTELRVLTRTENQFHMKGQINYRVQVKENGSVINTYQLNSKPSEVAAYKDDKDMIPGTACEFVIYVPEGKHVYEISPLDKDKPTLLGRMLIPRKDVKLEE